MAICGLYQSHIIQCLSIEDVRGVNSVCESCLVDLEKFLRESSHHQKVAVAFCSKKHMDVYRDMIDMIACEVAPSFREDCFAYYRGEGKLIIETYTKDFIRYEDQIMLTAAKIAVKMYDKSKRQTFGHVRRYMRSKGVHVPVRTFMDMHKL